MDYHHKVLPFYMTYYTPFFIKEEDSVVRDLDYLSQMYPTQAKRLQKRVAEILDRMDYEGSIIYDEYPDKWQLYRLTDVIVDIIKQEEISGGETIASEDKWEIIREMVQIVLYYEIYRRRHGNRRGFLKF